MVDNFLCNRVMLLLLLLTIVDILLLLNIVDIVVLKNNWLYIFSFNDNTDNGRQFFGHLPQLIIQRLSVYSQHSCSLRLIAATLL